jgi:hypothetical protein
VTNIQPAFAAWFMCNLTTEAGVKSSRRVAVVAALCGTVALAGSLAAGLAGLISRDGTGARIDVSRITSATIRAEDVDASQATVLGEHGGSKASGSAALSDHPPMLPPATRPVRIQTSSTPDPVRNAGKETGGSVENSNLRSTAALPDPVPMSQPAVPPVLFAAASPTDSVQNAAKPAVSTEALDACSDVCIDQYLWSLYERTPKVDTVKVEERVTSKVKNKGKIRTVVKTLIKYITEDFAWKDPKAAQKASMPLQDYVIGGMDRSFKRKLYGALRAMDEAGFSPGITSGFRDNYRQDLASGNKAASDSSYHGGSRRGGYGHGLAADLVSVKGETRAERYAWSEILWKWIDTHEKELGIGRPYLDKDPPHVAPIDGQEYADKRGPAKARLAGMKTPSLSSSQK